jgi:hypothetical protein
VPMQMPLRCRSLLVLLSLSGGALVAASTPVSTPFPAAALRAEVRRGAAEIAAVSAKKYPNGTAYRLMRVCLEKNVQERRASDAFLVGAHLTIALWVADLPQDISWREKAFARHRDLAEWLLSRLGLPPEEVAHLVVQGAGLPPSAERRLIEAVGR